MKLYTEIILIACCALGFSVPGNAKATDVTLEQESAADISRMPDYGIYVQQYYQHSQDADEANTYKLRYIRPWIEGRFNRLLQYTVMLEAAWKPELLDAHLDFRLFPGLQLRAGQWKVPFSGLWLVPEHAQHFIDFDLGQALSPGRDRGIAVYYAAPEERYQVSVGMFSGATHKEWDKNRRQNIALRASARPHELWEVSLAWYNGSENVRHYASVNNSLAVGIANRHPTWTCMAEYIRRTTDYFGSSANTAGSWAVVMGYGIPTNKQPVTTIEPMVRLDTLDYFAGNAGGRVSRATLGLNFYFNTRWNKVQLNYELWKEEGLPLENNRFSAGFQFAL